MFSKKTLYQQTPPVGLPQETHLLIILVELLERTDERLASTVRAPELHVAASSNEYDDAQPVAHYAILPNAEPYDDANDVATDDARGNVTAVG